jgi:hypothetical protein
MTDFAALSPQAFDADTVRRIWLDAAMRLERFRSPMTFHVAAHALVISIAFAEAGPEQVRALRDVWLPG